jgi:hypothetical protein
VNPAPVTREEQIVSGSVMITAAEIAPRIGISATERGMKTIHKMVEDRELPAARIGGQWMFHWPTVIAKKFPQAKK